MDFEDARAVGWSHKPWWWGGWGTYHVAPWGMADQAGWLLAVGAHEWLWGRDWRYRPEPGTPLYFVTLAGEPLFRSTTPDVRYRITRMTPVGDWPWWWQSRLDSDPDRAGTIAQYRGIWHPP